MCEHCELAFVHQDGLVKPHVSRERSPRSPWSYRREVPSHEGVARDVAGVAVTTLRLAKGRE